MPAAMCPRAGQPMPAAAHIASKSCSIMDHDITAPQTMHGCIICNMLNPCELDGQVRSN